MSRREEIKMTPAEITAFLAAELTAHVATIGPAGRPHLVPVFYVPAGNGIETWTYRKSQKVANLRRQPRATVLVETGRQYAELRGVSMECDVQITEDVERVAAIGFELGRRMLGTQLPTNSSADEAGDAVATAAGQVVRAQASKRVGLLFTPTKVVSWDHAKLGGAY